MKTLLALIAFTCSTMAAFAEEGDGAPRWFLLGDDNRLKQTFSEAKQVALVCIYSTTLEDVRPPFALVVHHATVVRSLKGGLKIGEKIEIVFATDSLPKSDEERETFVRQAHDAAEGDLRFAFLSGGTKPRFETEFLYVPDYSEDMANFLDALVAEPAKDE